ncbi:MAG: hypothetical protein KatS3mg064_2768 [Tepidiforma sp.]|nr:Gmad2 immunoglobulin-like domain-containing protein [Tepidiforma sp.]GIW19611.1 MAG: hypothetical protein KatS3mg064_2768 [Tepidiforma sp.]
MDRNGWLRMAAAAALLAAAGAVLGACSDRDDGAAPPPTAGEPTRPASSPSSPPAPTPTAAPPTAASPTPPATPGRPTPAGPTTVQMTGVCPPNPDPAPANVAVVTQPAPNASVTSPLTVTGMVEAFEATFQAELLDAQQNQLAHVVGMAQQGQVLSPFSVQLTFSVNQPTPGCLRVYQQSARDGSDTKIVLVPVVLLP